MLEEVSCRIGILTLSDKGSVGEREDTSSLAIQKLVTDLGSVSHYLILPDERRQIVEMLRQWSSEGLDLILTTGGTGFSRREITPEATLEVIETATPGISSELLIRSFEQQFECIVGALHESSVGD